MSEKSKAILFWSGFAVLGIGGTILWWGLSWVGVVAVSFSEGFHFVAGLLWLWMGLAQLRGFLPLTPSQAGPGQFRRVIGVLLLAVGGLFLADLFLDLPSALFAGAGLLVCLLAFFLVPAKKR